jgi:hypothetical protein
MVQTAQADSLSVFDKMTDYWMRELDRVETLYGVDSSEYNRVRRATDEHLKLMSKNQHLTDY